MSKNLYMDKIGKKAKLAALNLSNVNIDKKNSVLKQFSQYLKTNSRSILNSNKKDIANAKSKKIKGSHSSKIKNILGYSSREEIIHKDHLVKV